MNECESACMPPKMIKKGSDYIFIIHIVPF